MLKAPGTVAADKLNTSQQCTAAAKKANRFLSHIQRGITRGDREVIMLLFSALARPCVEYCVPFWSPQCKKDNDRLERVQRTMKMIKRWRIYPVRKD